jgi:glycosyltransferase involved in cell wall biosynthesis/SAM-dependent methyltransferase
MKMSFYRSFEDKYRGPRELIKSRLQAYLPFVLPFLSLFDPVTALDLGCGRGEWLELLREAGIETYGVDLDDAMLSDCRELGLAVATADAIETLEALQDETQAVVSGFHIVEHLPFQQAQRLVEEGLRVLKPGGLLILETPNPENIVVGSCSFYLDPTHQHPIPPKLLSFLPEFCGFARTKVVRLQEAPGLFSGETLTLKDVLTGVSPDYAVVAQKAGQDDSLSLFDQAFAKDYGVDLDTIADKYTALVANEDVKRTERNLRQELQAAFQRAGQADAQAAEIRSHLDLAEARARNADSRAAQFETATELAKARAQAGEIRLEQTRAALAAADARASLAEGRGEQARAALAAADARASLAEGRGEQARAALAAADARASLAEERGEQARAALAAADARASLAEERGEQARAALLVAEVGLREAARVSECEMANVAVLRGSTSWRLTRPVRVGGHLFRGRVGLALMEVGIPRERVQRLANIFRRRHRPLVPECQRTEAIGDRALDEGGEPVAHIGVVGAWRTDDTLEVGEEGGVGPVSLEADASLSYFPPIARRVYLDLVAGQQALRDVAPGRGEGEVARQSANEGRLLISPSPRRLRLAFVSPLPPERTGIAEYSRCLLEALKQYYEIDLVVCQDEVAVDLITPEMPIREVGWLRTNVGSIDWVIYQMGNSSFHKHMLPLMDEIPGTVVLHDFFLSHMLADLGEWGSMPDCLTRGLYESHGYHAVQNRFECPDIASVVMKHPANMGIIESACGVIVHSEHARSLADDWYGAGFAADWDVIPLARAPAERVDRERARASLGLPLDSFVVCSFGMATALKCSHRVLESWLHSRLAGERACMLIFVGEAQAGDSYCDRLRSTILLSSLGDRVRITGWVDTDIYKHYLAAADIAVQLRSLSRGETSAATLDCMNYGLPVIVNAHGSLAELMPDTVWMLPDDFEDAHLTEALETLWSDRNRRFALGRRAADAITTINSPNVCAAKYADAIEKSRASYGRYRAAIEEAHSGFDFPTATQGSRKAAALEVARSLSIGRRQKQLLLDVSATCLTDLKSGIERVARALALALLRSPPPGYRVEPVYLCNEGGHWHFRYATKFTLGLLNCPDRLDDKVVIPQPGDRLLGLDVHAQRLIDADGAGLLEEFREAGVSIRYMVYDLLPLRMPEMFPPGADISFGRWLNIVTHMDGAICGSKAVADDLTAWVHRNDRPLTRAFSIDWSHYGADLESSAPSVGGLEDFGHYLRYFSASRCFLMVGTIEPRKGHLQAIEAFSRLWNNGCDLNLIIVGNQGWRGLPDSMRRTIPDIVMRLRGHTELGKRLFWFDSVSDECLDKIYQASNCLIAASEGEGFGLPIIEAARHKLSVIARDIPVFREVAGDHAFYFTGQRPDDLANAVQRWLGLCDKGTHPKPDDLRWLTWTESAERVLRILISDDASFPTNDAFRPGEGTEPENSAAGALAIEPMRP